MNIEELSQNMTTRRMANATPNKVGKRPSDAKHETIKDSVGVSALTRLISESVSGLADIHKLRPEKVAQFKNFVHGTADISDQAIDTIMRRMTV